MSESWPVRAVVRPVIEGDDVIGWEIDFSLPTRSGQYYLAVFGRWYDEDGSLADQDATWTFHLDLR